MTCQSVRAASRRKHAGGQPLRADGDRDFGRAMLAREVGQRAGFGDAISARCSRPRGSAGSWRSCRRFPAAGTPPGRRPDAAPWRAAMSICAKAGTGTRISSAPRTAAPMSAVASAMRTSRRPLKSFSVMVEDLITRREGVRVAPPQPDLMALLGEIGGSGIGAVAPSQDCDAHADRESRCSCAGF